MFGSQEWIDMIDQEIKELHRLLDRKAENHQIKKYKLVYSQKRRTSFSQSTPSQQKDSKSPRSENSQSYRFGQDLSTDFSTLFGAFNRVAKNKLDNTILSDFAGVNFVDTIYCKKNTQFSTQLTQSCQLYYQLIDEKITCLSNKMIEFHDVVIERLDEIDYSTRVLRNRLNKITLGKQQRTQEKDKEDKSKKNKEFQIMKIRTLQSALNLNEDFTPLQDFSQTTQPYKRKNLMPRLDSTS